MKRSIISIFVFVFVMSTLALAQQNFNAEQPVLITSAGQSADILMVNILAKKASLDYKLDKTAAPESVDSVKSVILVCGGSTKGLGAAKIDKEQEFERAESLIKQAKQSKILVIAIHVGGKSRRGALSDYFNKLGAENADHMIIVKSGNEDGFFSEIAKNNNISIDLPEKIIAIQKLFEDIYAK